MYYSRDIDSRIKELVDGAVSTTQTLFGEQLTSIILHGSLAMGTYYFPKSDIDLLIIVNSALSPEKRKEYFRQIMEISHQRQTVGDIELSVVQRQELQLGAACVPYEVHFGEELKKDHDSFDYSLKRCDHDLPAHFMVAFHKGITLFGPPISTLMAEPSWERYRESVRGDLEWILSGENILTTPFYSILNCCRSYLLLIQKEQKVRSKEEGAELVMAELPTLKPMIMKALAAYKSDKPVTPETRRTNGDVWDRQDLLDFRDAFRETFLNANIELNLGE